MKKDSWKRFLCAMALVPCVGAMAGCEQKPEDPSTPPAGPETPAPESGQQTLTESQKYSKLTGAIGKLENGEQKVVSAEATQSEVVSMGDYVIVNQDGTTTPITDVVIKNMLNSQMIPMMGERLGGHIAKDKIVYNLDDGEMFAEHYAASSQGYEVEGEEGAEVYTPVSAEDIKAEATPGTTDLKYGTYIVKHGEDFIKHNLNASEAPVRQYVSAEHLLKSSSEGYKAVLDQNLGLAGVTDNETFEKFKETTLKTIVNFGYMFDLELSEDDFDVQFEIKEVGENYVLNVLASTKEPLTLEVGEGVNQEISMTMTQTVAFTDSKLLSTSNVANIEMATIMQIPLGGDPTDLTTVKVPMNMEMEMSVLLNDTISATDSVKLDDTRYEFEAADVAKATGRVNFNIDGVNVYNEPGEMDAAFVLNEEWLESSKTAAEFNGWYLDEACTIPFDADELNKFTSYDINLYTKTTSLKDGYVKVVITAIDEYDDEMGKQLTFYDAEAVTLSDFLQLDGCEVVSVVINGEEYDFTNNPTFTLESGQTYEFVVVYAYV